MLPFIGRNITKNLKVELGLLLGTGKDAMAWQSKVDGYDKDALYIVYPVIFRTFQNCDLNHSRTVYQGLPYSWKTH